MSSWRARLQMESEPAGTPVPPAIFMTGCMRSGTSFLASKLAQHPQVLYVGSELNDIWTDIGGAPCSTHCLRRDASDFNVESAQNMAAYFADYVKQSRRSRRALMRWRNKRRTGGGRITYDWPNVRCLNKSTHLTNKVPYVKSLFPRSKWIILVRSIWGNAASTSVFFTRLRKEKGLVMRKPADSSACWTRLTLPPGEAQSEPFEFKDIPEMWLRLNLLMFADLQQLNSDNVLVVPYERLVMNQAEEVARIFSFLDLLPRYSGDVQNIAGQPLKSMNTSTSGNPLTKWIRHLDDRQKQGVLEVVDSNQEMFNRINDALYDLTSKQGDGFRYPEPKTMMEEAGK